VTIKQHRRMGTWSTHRCVVACALGFLASTAVAAPDYEKDIRPIFERSCYVCHGPREQKSGYRLDVREVAYKGGSTGKAAIVAHDAEASPLIKYVSGADPEMRMPPENSGVSMLNADDIALLRAWIDAGPSWPDALAGSTGESGTHWSLKPLVKPAPPGPDANAIDAFVNAALLARGIEPSPAADRRTMIRRLYYDLTGLPPTPEETDAFVADADPAAYEKLVDRLLASPRYGERWARHWLDTIHFADSHGYEHDVGRENAWRFRDYVIASFNNDTPWDRFVREQIAADVLYPDEPWLTPALGFLGAGTFDLSTYSTAIVTFDYLDRDDLVTQTMASFVSTTANCARCHAHKFDPISQEDYYALQADFSGVLKGDVAYDEDLKVARERRHWREMLAAADARNADVLLAAENGPIMQAWIERHGASAPWTPIAAETYLSAEGAAHTRGADGRFVVSGPRPDKDTYSITASGALQTITAIRLDVLTDDTLPKKGPGRTDHGNFHLSEFEARVFEPGSTQARDVKFKRATADFNQADWTIEHAIDGDVKTAWGIDPEESKPHFAVFELSEPLTLSAGSQLAIVLKQLHGRGHTIGAYKLSWTDAPVERAAAAPMEVDAALAVKEAERTAEQRLAIAAHALRSAANEAIAKLPPSSYVYGAAKTVDIVSGDKAMKGKSLPEPKVVHLMERGEFDKPRAVIEPGALSALTHLPARFALKNTNDESERRAALAEWIAHRDNVLTWRSVVNRTWHYHFGRGICDTPSDFGEMGGMPSHPELIDWLAVWFRDEAKGSLKQLHRLIVTSETYRRSSEDRVDASELDGGNRLLWRWNRQRLDADAYRDFALAATGRLDLTMGGPGVQHFSQGKGPQLTPTLNYAEYDWNVPGAGRRSIYRFVWRGIADPFMEALDFPDLGLLSPTRAFSASSLQALALFNNNFVLQQSMAFAKRVEGESPDLEGQIARAVRLVWLRAPSNSERAEFAVFAQANGLPALCRVLLNSNEFMFVD
jgi:mono/diheme cytochrome c family protein